MNCIVTAGPTYEKMDKVRRLTNFSTGRLGVELANYLTTRGHQVTLLLGEQATYHGPRRAARVESFATTNDLRDWLQSNSGTSVDAVFHAAAVSDFTFGRLWFRSNLGELKLVKSGKVSTRQGTLMAELIPTPKIISSLRDWFPQAKLVGWKFEVDGGRTAVVTAAGKQIRECLTDASIANGPAYGDGFGLVAPNGKCEHMADHTKLFEALDKLITARPKRAEGLKG